MQDFPVFVNRKSLTFRDHLDQREEAIIDADHCVRLNYEAFFFSNLYTRERFVEDTLLYCGYLTDPVSKQRFRPDKDSPRFSHEKVAYYFENEVQRDQFKASPETFRLPGWKM
ncbi:MAG: YHS domain-containing protein [Planctomycetota bacterium]